MKNTIEKLKNNLAWYSELSGKEIAALDKVGKENCEYLSADGSWKIPTQTDEFSAIGRYHIKSDYQFEEESEYDVFEIKVFPISQYGYTKNLLPEKLSDALNDPTFAGVQFDEQEDEDDWSLMLRSFIDEDGFLRFVDNGKENMRPVAPSKIRFKK